MPWDESLVRRATRHLKAADPVLKKVIQQIGPFKFQRRDGPFPMLVRAIVSQQISTSAARSIWRRLEMLTRPEGIKPSRIADLSAEELRSAGISPQKSRYLHDLSAKILDNTVSLRRLPKLSDEGVIEELVVVKGIGCWTAQMFLIFHLGRPDVLPHDDLGLRSAMRDLYGLPALPNHATVTELAAPWRPYASLASWYCWRSSDTVPGQ